MARQPLVPDFRSQVFSTSIKFPISIPHVRSPNTYKQAPFLLYLDGILPTNYGTMYSILRSATGSSLPVNTEIEHLPNRPSGFPVSFTMTQQGFTANVSCAQRPVNETTSPSMRLLSATQSIFNATSTITLAQLVVRCPNAVQSIISRGYHLLSLMFLVCPIVP